MKRVSGDVKCFLIKYIFIQLVVIGPNFCFV